MDISKGRPKAIRRFDGMHTGFSAFSGDEERQKDMEIPCLVIPLKL